MSDTWSGAATLAALRELTARWLLGEIPACPTNGDTPPDSETEAIADVLAQINRAGFLTDFSQPGERSDGWWQRAAVSGFCDERTARTVYRALAGTDLLVLTYEPGTVDGPQMIPISIVIDDEQPDEYEEQLPQPGARIHTWTGTPFPPDIVASSFDEQSGYSPLMTQELKRSWQVHVIDLRWGREDHLWSLLLTALTSPADVEMPS